MKNFKKELYDLYIYYDRLLQDNWQGIALILFIVVITFLAFIPERVDFDAISAHLP